MMNSALTSVARQQARHSVASAWLRKHASHSCASLCTCTSSAAEFCTCVYTFVQQSVQSYAVRSSHSYTNHCVGSRIRSVGRRFKSRPSCDVESSCCILSLEAASDSRKAERQLPRQPASVA